MPNYLTSCRSHPSRHPSRTWSTVSTRSTPGAPRRRSQREIIWFGTRATLKRLENTNLSLHVGTDTVTPSNVVRDLGVRLNSELTMRQHISKTVGAYFYHLRRLKKVRRIFESSVICRLVTAFVTSCLDYCKALLAGLPQSTIAPLQRVQNAAVRLVSGLRTRDYVTSSLRVFHWLPIRYRIMYKL